MFNTDKWTCRHAALALAAFGVESVVTSPGSRNAPLLLAVARHERLHVYPVVDERSAAFIALGIAEVSQQPVALVCTSGTALLNYAPAVCEAYHKHIPLIVISADRPAAWIDQADSQTMRQPGALANFVKQSIDLKAEANTDEEQWFAWRQLNEILECAISDCPGPVHINIRISEPLTNQTDACNDAFRRIRSITPSCGISADSSRTLAAEATGKNILIVAGPCPPDDQLNHAIATLAGLPQVVVLAEGLSNLHFAGLTSRLDCVIPHISSDSMVEYTPDLLITFGGAIVSAPLKRFLRHADIAEHWHVGTERNFIDTFKHLSTAINAKPECVFPMFAAAMENLSGKESSLSNYKRRWIELKKRGYATCDEAIATNRWNALSAISKILGATTVGTNLQLSNGLAVRLASLSGIDSFHRVDSNRGVSGIDGSTSTAIGAALAYTDSTMLITGDMSFQYDIGALTCNHIKNNFKIVLLNNGGGGIFRFINPTRNLPEVDKLFCCELNLNAHGVATAFGFMHYRADSYASLHSQLPGFMADSRPAILEIITDSSFDAEMLRTITKQK